MLLTVSRDHGPAVRAARACRTLKDSLGRTPLALATVTPNPTVKSLFSRLHVAVQLSLSRGIGKKGSASAARRASLEMIGAGTLITPAMNGVRVVALLIGNAEYEHGTRVISKRTRQHT